MNIRPSENDHELLIRISESFLGMKQEFIQMREEMKQNNRDLVQNYATRAELASFRAQITNMATRDEMKILETRISPFTSALTDAAKFIMMAIVASVMGLILIKNQ